MWQYNVCVVLHCVLQLFFQCVMQSAAVMMWHLIKCAVDCVIVGGGMLMQC